MVGQYYWKDSPHQLYNLQQVWVFIFLIILIYDTVIEWCNCTNKERAMVNYPHKVIKLADALLTNISRLCESLEWHLKNDQQQSILSFSRGWRSSTKPTPIQIVKVDIHVPVEARMFEAIWGRASTTDYSGVHTTGDAISILKLRKHSKSSLCRWKIFINIQIDHMGRLSIEAICFVLALQLSETCTSCSCINSLLQHRSW